MIARLKKIPFPNKLFLVLALVFGLLMIKTVPPLQAPDEVGHFAKAVAFSEFKIQPKFFSNESHEKTRTNKKIGILLDSNSQKK